MRKHLNYSWLTLVLFSCLLINNVQAQGHGEHNIEEEKVTENLEEPASADESVAESLDEEGYDPTPVIMHHIQDTHGFHVYGEGEHAVSVPLPVILWTDNGLVTFMSSAFHHDNEGHHVVERKGMSFVNHHETIYQLEEGAHHVEFDEDHHATNAAAPLDLSITKNAFTLIMAGVILCLVFIPVANRYKSGHEVPKGLASFMEPLVVFVRDNIAVPNIGPKYQRFMPLLLTMFFLIWLLNLIGLIPFFPFSANMSGNIAFTMVLALITLIVTNASGNKAYLRHIFWPPGVPVWLMPIMIPVEIIGVFTKPFALMIRLFANITAGHIIVLSLISLIFIFKSVAMAAVSVPFALFISVLELLVAALQAYIFTMLTALFIGTAVADDHH